MRSSNLRLLLLFSVIEASWQTLPQIIFSNAANQRYFTQQLCSNVRENTCCVPIDVNIAGLGSGWFHAKHLFFNKLPEYNVHLGGWKYQHRRSNCNGELVVQYLTIGDATAAYTNNSPEGFSGALYYAQGPPNGNRTDTNNGTLQVPNPGVKNPNTIQFPDEIKFQGESYGNGGSGTLLYVSASGKIITGAPLLGMSTSPGG